MTKDRIVFFANGVPTGISLPNVCYSGGGEGETKKECKEVIFDIQEEEGLK